MTTRRSFLGGAAALLVPAVATGQDSAQPDADRLRDQVSIGRLRDTLTALDNDPVIIAIERRLRCTCGCTLDIYTCRTTDFSCTFSPALHKEVMGMYSDGKTAEQIIAAFVEREGEAILMAPPAEGFNLTGYLVPGTVMLAGVLGLTAWVMRRRSAVAGAGEVSSATPAEVVMPDDEQRERLRRALDEVVD
ncbi:MAG TPA: cytochrome c-type biogenesis protein CcmH [Gemmatimonadales bacterium]|nr:cytochrome c-type biogenesis protein CcmH [Gemmatimonadales bacterium]